MAKEFAEPFGGGELAYYAGLWHDLGKFTVSFQQYLETQKDRRGPPHSHVGALLAEKAGLHDLSFVIAGHHTGLPNESHLGDRIAEAQEAGSREERLAQEAMAHAKLALSGLERANLVDQSSPRVAQDFFIRMIFSALVDADSLDTEKHFHPQKADLRSPPADWQALRQRFEEHQRRLEEAYRRSSGPSQAPVGEMRRRVYLRCLEAAREPQGFYRLTVPTGGGKTLSSMAFALQHATVHHLHRIIVAIPYTSIIEQTAKVYRDIFGEKTVLEHHSAASWQAQTRRDNSNTLEEASQDPGVLWSQLAAENWDTPIIVTTFVQLFESLFSNRRIECRKLHSIAGSVLILDEVQTLPTEMLAPILSALRELVESYQVTVVLCSATLPAFAPVQVGRDALPEAKEIVPDYVAHFQNPSLQRVSYQLHHRTPWTWEKLAEESRRQPQGMVILNTRPDALAFLDVLQDDKALHLSTLLCPAHRRAVLRLVHYKLKKQKPCILVTTQVVEAGVDLDFPVVFRAMGPLDRIVQAAGRCNREGRLPNRGGQVVVFEPLQGHLPERSGSYFSGTLIARRLLASVDPEALTDPALYQRYYQELFPTQTLDAKNIQPLRTRLDFPMVAQLFRLIEEDTEPAVVHYKPHERTIKHLLDQARSDTTPARAVFRKLQPYIVEVRRSQLPDLFRKSLIQEVRPGLWEWLGTYDMHRGIGVPQKGIAPELLVVG